MADDNEGEPPMLTSKVKICATAALTLISGAVLMPSASASTASASVAAVGQVRHAAHPAASTYPTAPPAGTECSSFREEDGNAHGDSFTRAGVSCSAITPGYEVRAWNVADGMFDGYSTWSDQLNVLSWSDWRNSNFGSEQRIQYRLKPVCWAHVEKQNVRWGADLYRVVAGCSQVDPHTTIRGVLDIPAHTDVHTPWFSQPGTHVSQWRHSTWGTPTARLDVD